MIIDELMMNKALKSKIEPEFNRASSLWKQGKVSEAVEILQELNNEFSNQSAILGMLGAVHYTNGDFVSSLSFFQQVVELSPKSEMASRALFHLLVSHEIFEEELTEAKRFIRLNGLTKEYEMIISELDDAGIFL